MFMSTDMGSWITMAENQISLFHVSNSMAHLVSSRGIRRIIKKPPAFRLRLDVCEQRLSESANHPAAGPAKRKKETKAGKAAGFVLCCGGMGAIHKNVLKYVATLSVMASGCQ
jgi:hypothetical protein